jgi:hypothetical protein
MKVLKCKIGWLLAVLIFAGQSVSAKEFERNIKKSSPISANGLVELSNTRGTIDVRTWNKNEVSIDVLITVNARNIGDANQVFDRIQIKFDSYKNRVNSRTIIHDVPKWNYVRSEYTIDYVVYMPKKCNLSLFNKYGDALIAELEGKATLSVQHGNIRLKTIERLLTLDLKYGNCTVARAANSEITMVHGNIRLKKAENINFATSYSKINVDEAADIKSTSVNDTYKLGIVQEFRNIGKYDKIEIKQVDNIIVFSKFTDFKIDVVNKHADFDMVYGSVEIAKVTEGFSDILMVGENTDFRLNVEEGSDYKMNATARYANLKYPTVSNIIWKDTKGDEQKVEFYVGKKANPYSYIKARVKYGDISIK